MIGAALDIHTAAGPHAHAANLLGGFLLLLGTAAYVAAFSLVLCKVADARGRTPKGDDDNANG